MKSKHITLIAAAVMVLGTISTEAHGELFRRLFRRRQGVFFVNRNNEAQEAAERAEQAEKQKQKQNQNRNQVVQVAPPGPFDAFNMTFGRCVADPKMWCQTPISPPGQPEEILRIPNKGTFMMVNGQRVPADGILLVMRNNQLVEASDPIIRALGAQYAQMPFAQLAQMANGNAQEQQQNMQRIQAFQARYANKLLGLAVGPANPYFAGGFGAFGAMQYPQGYFPPGYYPGAGINYANMGFGGFGYGPGYPNMNNGLFNNGFNMQQQGPVGMFNAMVQEDTGPLRRAEAVVPAQQQQAQQQEPQVPEAMPEQMAENAMEKMSAHTGLRGKPLLPFATVRKPASSGKKDTLYKKHKGEYDNRAENLTAGELAERVESPVQSQGQECISSLQQEKPQPFTLFLFNQGKVSLALQPGTAGEGDKRALMAAQNEAVELKASEDGTLRGSLNGKDFGIRAIQGERGEPAYTVEVMEKTKGGGTVTYHCRTYDAPLIQASAE